MRRLRAAKATPVNRRLLFVPLLAGIAQLAPGKVAAASQSCVGHVAGLGAEDFHAYIDAFNSNDFEGFSRYYADDVDFQGRAGHFRGRAEVLAYYREVKSRMRETITIKDIVVGDAELLVDIVTELEAFRDWPEFATGPVLKGQVIRSENFVWYQVRKGRFAQIRSAGYRRL